MARARRTEGGRNASVAYQSIYHARSPWTSSQQHSEAASDGLGIYVFLIEVSSHFQRVEMVLRTELRATQVSS